MGSELHSKHMSNLNTPLHNNTTMNANPADRKRKVSARSRSCSSLDTDSEDNQSNQNLEIKKIPRMTPHVAFTKTEPSSSRRESSSESDSDETEKCPICLKVLKKQQLGITDSCNHHMFCLSCLEEWSKTKKTCPVDRKEYKSILVLDSNGNVFKQLPLKSSFGGWSPVYEPTFCEVCGLFTNEDEMLVCDGCGMGYHLYCLMPAMENPPTGVWLCNDCWYYYNY